MVFLYQNEDQLHKDDLEFSYRLAKYLQKVSIQNKFHLALCSEQNIIWFFSKAEQFKIKVTFKTKNQEQPIIYRQKLPLEIHVMQFKSYLRAVLINRDDWLFEPHFWYLYKFGKDTVCFSYGKILINPSQNLIEFLDQFTARKEVIYNKQGS